MDIRIEELLNDLGSHYSPLSRDCQAEFMAKSRIKQFQKGEIVIREGQYSKKGFLIIQGCSRAYYLKDGKDTINWFAFENQFMVSIVSFFSNAPSAHYVEFVEDATAMQFSKETVDYLSNRYHDFERLISKIVTETMLGLCERLHSIQFNKADERYDHLLSIYPSITTRIPLRHIASYLGITLETLSRIRNPRNRI